MADERTDKEAADDDGLPLFTAAIETPARPSQANALSAADAKLRAPLSAITGYAYRDMRGQWWHVKWNTDTFTWNAYPLKATAAAYNAQFGTTMDPKRMYAAATDSPGIIEAIDERIEIARVNASKSGGFPWWLVLLGAFAYYSKKNRRR